MIGIYRIFCIIDGQSYIGQSKNIEKRWEQHDEMLANGKHHSKKLQQAYNMYGPNCFVKMILQLYPVYDKDILNRTEEFWIHSFNSYHRGFNMKPTA